MTDTPNPTIREYIQVGLQARANRARTGIVITVKESPEGFTIETWTRMEHKLQTTQYPNLDELFDRIMYAETAGG